MRTTFETLIPVSSRHLYDWHMRDGAFERLVPPWQSVKMLSRSGPVSHGSTVVFRVAPGIKWVAEHADVVDGERFTDIQRQGPFALWAHTHQCIDRGDHSLLRDEIDWSLPFGFVSDRICASLMRRFLDRMFSFRHARTREDLMQHHTTANEITPVQIAISGSTGLIGRRLVPFLTTGGHVVRPLVRRAPKPGTNEVMWSPEAKTISPPGLDGIDAVIHLAAENIADGRWTPERKQRFAQSRVEGTRLLAETIARSENPPKVMVSASAIGFYGNRADEELDEYSTQGTGFLADLTHEWEQATLPAVQAGTRVVLLRIGVVLAADGGALAKMLPPFRLGVGGPVGGGQQWLSWISIDDAVYAIHHCLFHPEIRGPVNLVAPNPVRNGDFAKTLGHVLNRPAVIPVPAWTIRALFGEMGQETVLSSARVAPTVLTKTGFQFRFPTLSQALEHEFGV